jgi:hypothetical protein
MKLPDILASVGVVILLIAFLLNLYKKLNTESKIYSLLNLIGAAFCCLSSWLISFYPFRGIRGGVGGGCATVII